jgi:amino-acid N-acetyltransferase
MKNTRRSLRKAKIDDIASIHALVNHYAEQDVMLPRSLNEIYENIRDYWVFIDKGRVCGCAALHVSWENLAEIKSLAVEERLHRRGIGAALVGQCLDEALSLGVKTAFALTYVPEFFQALGFRKVPKEKLPHKIWAECIKCHKFPHCSEIALIKKLH